MGRSLSRVSEIAVEPAGFRLPSAPPVRAAPEGAPGRAEEATGRSATALRGQVEMDRMSYRRRRPVHQDGAEVCRRFTPTSRREQGYGFTDAPLPRSTGPEPGKSGASSSLL